MREKETQMRPYYAIIDTDTDTVRQAVRQVRQVRQVSQSGIGCHKQCSEDGTSVAGVK